MSFMHATNGSKRKADAALQKAEALRAAQKNKEKAAALKKAAELKAGQLRELRKPSQSHGSHGNQGHSHHGHIYTSSLEDGYCLKCRQRAKEKAAALQKAAQKKAAEKKAAEKKAVAQHERGRMAAATKRPCLDSRPSYHRNQSALICRKCQQSSNLRRIPDLKDGTFLCPPCRLRDAHQN
eukprot:g18802.t1